MYKVLATFSIAILVTASHATFYSRRHIMKPDFNNKKSDNELLGEHTAQSLTECAALCQKDCHFFGFHSIMMKCRVHQMVFTSASGMSVEPGWRYYALFIPIDCKDLHLHGHSNSGVYEIYPFRISSRPITVYCDMATLDGGWTVIQKRINGSLNFDRSWTEYKNGFGAPAQDIWIGNDVIHELTKVNHSYLYVSITLTNDQRLYELYDQFSVSDEVGQYKLLLAGIPTGTLGDSMLNVGPGAVLSGMYFGTPDRDNDKNGGSNCAADNMGGWWFNYCHDAFLNGPWSSGDWVEPWNPAVMDGRLVKETVMMVKRH